MRFGEIEPNFDGVVAARILIRRVQNVDSNITKLAKKNFDVIARTTLPQKNLFKHTLKRYFVCKKKQYIFSPLMKKSSAKA